MRKFIVFIILFSTMQLAYAMPGANIKIAISGPIHDNTYFLCMPDLGCLSMLASKKGKTYHVIRPVDMNTLFVTDTHTLRVYNQGLPNSCNKLVDKGHTITIRGRLVKHGDQVAVKQLHCTVA